MSETISCRFEFNDSPQGWSAGLRCGVKFFLFRVSVKKDGTEPAHYWKKEKAAYIKKVQALTLEQTANEGIIFAPENCVTEFWTRDYILKMADALRRPRKRKSHPHLKKLLGACWVSCGLDKMDRSELAEYLNTIYGPKSFTPAAAWQAAYNLNLFTKRPPGPKPRKQSASKF